jgi:mannosyl-3-phosphoglycerate phosphatase
MVPAFFGAYLRQTSCVLYLAVDSLIPVRGNPVAGLDEFTASLDHSSIPAVWVSSRTRLQLDEPRRKNGHTHPFIGEGGCAVFLPEDYFHLRPAKTLRLGRFTSIPVAQPQPAAQEALASLAADTGVEAVPLRSLSPRELAQNSGLPARDAEMARQRDFDELFFFAGASDADVARFVAEAQLRKLALRQHGVLWSLAVGASLQRCVRELAKLYDRALRYHAVTLGVAEPPDARELFAACERNILLVNERALAGTETDDEEQELESAEAARGDENDRVEGHDRDEEDGRDESSDADEASADEVPDADADASLSDKRVASPRHKKAKSLHAEVGKYSLTIPRRVPEMWQQLLEVLGSRTYK